MTVVHDWPIRGRKQQPAEEYGRAYARDPVKWLEIKRRRLALRRAAGRAMGRQRAEDLSALKRRGWIKA